MRQARFDGEWHAFSVASTPTASAWRDVLAASATRSWTFSACGDGFAFAACDPRFGLLQPDGTGDDACKGRAPRTCATSSATPSRSRADGDARRFGLGFGDDSSRSSSISLAASLADAPARARPVSRPRASTAAGHQLAGQSDAPSLAGKPIALEQYEDRALAGDPADRAGFALGTEWSRARVRRGRQAALAEARRPAPPGASISQPTARSSPSPMATARSAGCAGATGRSCWRCSSSAHDAALGRLDADRLLHGLARRRGSDRLARQSRLGAAGRLLPRLALLATASTGPTSCSSCCETRDEGEAVRQANAGGASGRRTSTPLTAKLPPVIRDPRAGADGGAFPATRST